MKTIEVDYVIIGSGISGLFCALQAACHGRVAVISKAALMAGSSSLAQGGICLPMGPGDSPKTHGQDTLLAGDGHCNPQAVNLLVKEGPLRLQQLHQWGVEFDRSPDGQLAFSREAAHSLPRVISANKDATGQTIIEKLLQKAAAHPSIDLYDRTMSLELLMDGNSCRGVWAVDPEGRHLFFFSRAVVLATGGCGQLYRYTTQPVECTGDGLAMAYRAGAILADLEFIQFHPTALACQQNPLPLISEAVRGEGAHLVNQRNQQFMAGIHPREELAPRDIVARSVYRQVSQGNQVFLDISNLEESFPLRFPNIHRSCLEHGIDLQSNLLPVSPAAHFIMGGVYTDLQGQTSLKGLFAVGETACTGVHGANRLASNSLLEGIVFAYRVAGNLPLNPDGQLNTASLSWPHHLLQHSSLNQTLEQRPDEDIPTPVPDQPRKALQNLMWEQVGLIRNRHQLTSAREALTQMDRETPPQIIELHNMLTVARGITRGALARTESRGSHLREDYPHPSPLWAGQRIPYRRC